MNELNKDQKRAAEFKDGVCAVIAFPCKDKGWRDCNKKENYKCVFESAHFTAFRTSVSFIFFCSSFRIM